MNDAIIGGAIAAVIGLVGGFVTGIIASVWQERRREKAQRLAIVDALIVETAENLITCKDFETLDLWWTRSFKQLESVNKGLRRWRVVHSRTVAFRIRRRLRNLVSKIRSNSKLNHS